MRCDEADDLIDAFVEDGFDERGLDAARRRDVDAHVATCARCGRALDASRRLSSALARLPVAAPSAAADARARAAIEEVMAWARWRARSRRALVALAATAAVATAAFGVFVAAPAAASLDQSAAALLRVGETWMRVHAVPTLFEARWTLVGAFLLFVVVAALDRMFTRDEAAARPAR
jgi:anti-sigma factor RsiW